MSDGPPPIPDADERRAAHLRAIEAEVLAELNSAHRQAQAGADKLPVAFVASKLGPVTDARRLTWDALATRLGEVTVGPKDGPGWLPADIDPGPRTGARVRCVSALVIDVDGKGQPAPSVDAMLVELALWGWRCVLHTTHSHDEHGARYRVVFALSRPLAAAEIKPLGLHAAAMLGIADSVDHGCLEPARLFFLPRCPAERLALFRHAALDGAPLDVDALLGEARKAGEAAKAPRGTGQRSVGVIEAFNRAHDIGAVLERHGYRAKGRGRWVYPESETGMPGVRLLPDSDPPRIYSSHAMDPLNTGHAHDAFSAWCVLDHAGDQRVAVKAAAALLGMERERPAQGAPAPEAPAGGDTDEVRIVSAADIRPEPVDWTWCGWLAAGKLHILAGAPGTGKTTLALAMAATVSAGGRWPDGTRCPAGDVLIWSGEDDPGDTIVPRLLANGADVRRCHIIRTTSDAERRPRPFDPATDMPRLLDAVVRCEIRPRLLILDPVVAAVSGDSHKNSETRRGLQPVVDLVLTLRCAALGISHYSKGTAGRDPVERVTGSIAFGALPRIVLGAAKRSEEDGGGRLLVRAKSNLGPDGGGYQYDLAQSEVPGHPGLLASQVLWGESIDGTARDLLAAAEVTGDPEERSERQEAADWLRDLLAGGPLRVKDIMAAARDYGHSERTLQRARRQIGATVERDGFGGVCRWRLPIPATPAHTCHSRHTLKEGKYGENGPDVASMGGADDPAAGPDAGRGDL